jgi:hypothetical protein
MSIWFARPRKLPAAPPSPIPINFEPDNGSIPTFAATRLWITIPLAPVSSNSGQVRTPLNATRVVLPRSLLEVGYTPAIGMPARPGSPSRANVYPCRPTAAAPRGELEPSRPESSESTGFSFKYILYKLRFSSGVLAIETALRTI